MVEDPNFPQRARPAASPAGLSFHALVPAAGRGTRYGGARPKQFRSLAGRPLLAHAVERLLAAGAASVVVALPEGELEAAERELAGDPRLRFVVGGPTRQASVGRALAASPAAAADLIAVHDGARPALAAPDLEAVVRAASAGAAVLGRPVTDTIKRVEGGRILATLDRAALFRAETPQVFRRDLLEQALLAAERDGFVGTDEAALVERLGGIEIRAVVASKPNPKVTLPEDLAEAARLLGAEEAGG